MNRIVRTAAAILLPFAAGAIALSVAGSAAHADTPPKGPNGPIIINPTQQPPKPPKPGPSSLAPAPQQPTGGPTDLAPAPQEPKDEPTDWAPAPQEPKDEPTDWAPAPADSDDSDDSDGAGNGGGSGDGGSAPADQTEQQTGAPTAPAPAGTTTAPSSVEPVAQLDSSVTEAESPAASTTEAGIPVALYAALAAGLLGIGALVILLARRRRV